MGLARWGMTSVSTPISTYGNVRFKLDKVPSVWFTPLWDTCELIRRINIWHDGRINIWHDGHMHMG